MRSHWRLCGASCNTILFTMKSQSKLLGKEFNSSFSQVALARQVFPLLEKIFESVEESGKIWLAMEHQAELEYNRKLSSEDCSNRSINLGKMTE